MDTRDYWAERAAQRMLDIELLGNGYAGRMYWLYQQLYSDLTRDMEKLLDAYIESGGWTPEEALKYLREPIARAEQDMLLGVIEHISDPAQRRRMLARINSGSYKARMTRLQALRENIRAQCAKAAEAEIALDQEALRNTGREAYLRRIFDTQQEAGQAFNFASVSILELDELAAQRWIGESFSARVWANAAVMADRLGEIVRVNVATGRSWQQSLREVREFAATPGQGALYAAERLLRTETNRMANELSAKASQGIGAKRYRYIATLDLRTSEICRIHDGLIDPDTKKPYTYANRKPGKNFPPLHSNCRSCEAPVMDGQSLEGMMRAARDPVTGKPMTVPAGMTYPEWYEKYVASNPEAVVQEKMIKNTASDRRQHQRYREIMGKEVPGNLAGFQKVKYTDGERWGDLKYYARNKGDRPLYCVKIDRDIEKLGITGKGRAFPPDQIDIVTWSDHALKKMASSGASEPAVLNAKFAAKVRFRKYPEPETVSTYYHRDGLVGVRERDGRVTTVIWADRIKGDTMKMLEVIDRYAN